MIECRRQRGRKLEYATPMVCFCQRSSHEMQEQRSGESMQPLATVCGVHPQGGGEGSKSTSSVAPSHARRVSCLGPIRACVLHAEAGLLRARTPTAPSKHTITLDPK